MCSGSEKMTSPLTLEQTCASLGSLAIVGTGEDGSEV